jgi:hypothetical protein
VDVALARGINNVDNGEASRLLTLVEEQKMQKFSVMDLKVIKQAFMVLEKKNKKEKGRPEMEQMKEQISYMVKILENILKKNE